MNDYAEHSGELAYGPYGPYGPYGGGHDCCYASAGRRRVGHHRRPRPLGRDRERGRLTVTPRPAGVKALAGHADLLRIRVGDYRVVYTVRDEQLVVLVIAAAHRRELYRDR
jgi:mRNA interferase RelE/StbE